MSRPERPIAADWLALRREADTAARDRAAWLLADALDQTDPSDPPTIFDVGAGTGANRAYLEPRLGMRARWVLLDHDADLLDASGHGDGERIVAGIGDLDRLVTSASGQRLVTCSALLDLLTADELDGLAALLSDHGIRGLFSLTVDGTLEMDPPDADDDTIASAFNAHQSRNGRPGPLAAAYLSERCRQRGLIVRSAETPWLLDARSAPLVQRLLAERADAVVEERPELEDVARRWLRERVGTLREGDLSVRIGHIDLLVTPAV